MSRNDYEYECMRAELLGLEKPDRAEFEQNQVQLVEEVLAGDSEQMGRVSGGLDELNARIDSTKKKLTRYQRPYPFRQNCLSFFVDHPTSINTKKRRKMAGRSQPMACSSDSMHKSSLNFEEYERQNDKLDALLNKAERAELSLNRNNKLIRKLVRK